MKIKSILLSMLAVAALASCSKDDNTGGENPNPGDIGRAYLSVSIPTTKSYATRTGEGPVISEFPGNEAGTPTENAISELLIVGFADVDGGKQLGDYLIENITDEAVGATEAVAVDGNIKSIFVIANPTPTVKELVKKTTSYEGVPLYGLKADTDTAPEGTARDFMMTSGAQNKTSGVTVTNDKGLTELTTGNLQRVTDDFSKDDAKLAAKADPAIVFVDRIVAKVVLNKWTYKAAADRTLSNAPNAKEASLTGWLINTMNKKSGLYTQYVQATVADGVITSGYRRDHNFDVAMTPTIIEEGLDPIFDPLLAEFHHYGNEGNGHGGPKPLWPTIDTGDNPFEKEQYCTENTMSKVAYQNGQTTKLLIKAVYVPKEFIQGSKANSSDKPNYFMVSFPLGVQYWTLAQLKEYADLGNPKPLNQVNRDYLNKVATAINSQATSLAQLTDETHLNDADPYAVAKVDPNGAVPVAYYHKSVCYYALNIKHNSTLGVFADYHYGVVRNNWYKITIKDILKPGTSYIPDPTDPDIKDPEKPDPEDPNDPAEGFLSVQITVNNWLTAGQTSDLD